MRAGMHALAALAAAGLACGLAQGHYHILLPQAASAKRGEAVAVRLLWGHPFEHQLFAAAMPQKLFVFGPDGGRTDLLAQLTKETVADKITSFRLSYSPRQRGDFVFVAQCPPVWLEEDAEFVQDCVKVVLHVQAQKGWDADAGEAFELVPLTRPYGLQPGVAFQAQARGDGKPFAGGLVEVERYNATPPRELPPEEQITRTCKTDPNGVCTATLTEPGWWCLTAQRPGGTKMRDGKPFPVRQRATLWVFVDDKPAAGK